MSTTPAGDLKALLDETSVVEQLPATYLADLTEVRGRRGEADAAVFPSDAEGVARLVDPKELLNPGERGSP